MVCSPVEKQLCKRENDNKNPCTVVMMQKSTMVSHVPRDNYWLTISQLNSTSASSKCFTLMFASSGSFFDREETFANPVYWMLSCELLVQHHCLKPVCWQRYDCHETPPTMDCNDITIKLIWQCVHNYQSTKLNSPPNFLPIWFAGIGL